MVALRLRPSPFPTTALFAPTSPRSGSSAGAVFVEIGASDDGANSQVCNGGTATNIPYLFRVYVINGFYRCLHGGNLTSWVKDGFGVEDQNLDTYFIYWHNGNNLGQLGPMPFSKGTVLTNAERHDTRDNAPMIDNNDVLTRLREANPVRIEDLPQTDDSAARAMLGSIVVRRTTRKGLASRRTVLAAAAVAATATATAAAVVTLTREESPSAPAQRVNPGARLAQAPTLAHPLGPSAQPIQLAHAAATLGARVALPNTSLVKPSDAGPVWATSGRESDTGDTDPTVAVTFPAAGLIVQYERPVPYSDPERQYQGMANLLPNKAASVVDLNGVPGLAIKPNADQTGANLGSIEFVADGTRVVVMGHYDEPALREVALSILAGS
jgi:hypothetical protein